MCLTLSCASLSAGAAIAVVCLQGPFLPGYTSTPDEPAISYGLQRLDHAVGNVPQLVEKLEHIMGFTGEWFRVWAVNPDLWGKALNPTCTQDGLLVGGRV